MLEETDIEECLGFVTEDLLLYFGNRNLLKRVVDLKN
jgi:hypothetical protein